MHHPATMVSIICTVYNKGRWLTQTIESLLQQKDITFELLLIDDASTDNSRDIIAHFANRYPDTVIAVYNDINLGISKTWQKACLMAKGTYIARCDGDDYWIDDYKLAKQVELLEGKADSKWCGTDINYVDSSDTIISKDVFSNHIIELADSYEKLLATRGFTAPSTWLVERELMLEVNALLDEDIDTADDTFNLQLDLFKRTEFTFLQETTVAYRINAGSDSRPQRSKELQNRFDKLLQTQLYYLEKYPNTNYKHILELALERSNHFEKHLSQQEFIHSNISSQHVTIYFASQGETFSQEKMLVFPLSYQDRLDFTVSENTTRLRIDLSELSSFYRRVSLVANDVNTEILPSSSNGVLIGDYVMFTDDDPQLIYDVSCIKEKNFTLSYQMFNVDDISKDDYIAKVLSQDIKHYRDIYNSLKKYELDYNTMQKERDYYKAALEEMVVRYNSVTHSRRWTIPTKIIDLFRRDK